jgi:hypothetical protein
MDKIKQQVYGKTYSSQPKKYPISEVIAYHDKYYRHGDRVARDDDKYRVIDHNINNHSKAIAQALPQY